MNGREVFRFATTVMPKATEQVGAKAGWQTADLALVIPHQANSRIIDSAIKRLGLPAERFFVNMDRYGNTSAASIPIALCEAIAAGRVKPGDKLVLVGFGAGSRGRPRPSSGVCRCRPSRSRAVPSARTHPVRTGRVRSALLRTERHVYNWIMGPVGKDDWRGKLRQRVDRFRSSRASKPKN